MIEKESKLERYQIQWLSLVRFVEILRGNNVEKIKGIERKKKHNTLLVIKGWFNG